MTLATRERPVGAGPLPATAPGSSAFVLRCDLARSWNPVGEMPTCITASHGRSIQPCSQSGNGVVDA